MNISSNPKSIIAAIQKLLGELDATLDRGQKHGKAVSYSTINNIGNHSGVLGGIRLLISNDFLKKPQTVEAVDSELQKHGYIYRREVISTALLRSARKGILTRLNSKGKWAYVERK